MTEDGVTAKTERFLEWLSQHQGWMGVAGAFLLGLVECRGSCGMTYDGANGAPRSRAYDTGRGLGQRVLRVDA